jgi:ubiquinone/menaquinone biosynthesis C-methylase UbiE
MNRVHHWICGSNRWRNRVQHEIVPWALEGVELGQDVLEIGPGPGATTEVLRSRVGHLTCVEIDARLATRLAGRMAGTNVTVLCESATDLSLPDASFDGAVSLTMLHHVPSVELQDRLLAEVARVLRPGGTFAGVDSLTTPLLRLVHLRDTLVAIDPRTFAARLAAAGFTAAEIDVRGHQFRFRAKRGERA